MVPTRILIAFGQEYAITTDMIDSTDMLTIGTDDFLMLGYLAKRLPLRLAILPPRSEVLLEL